MMQRQRTAQGNDAQAQSSKTPNKVAFRASRAMPSNGARGYQDVTVALIDPRPFGRASIKSMLEQLGPEFSVAGYPHAEDLVGEGGTSAKLDLVLVYIGSAGLGDAALRATLNYLREHLGSVPLALLAEEAPLEEMVAAMQLGVRGYLPTCLEPEEAIQALRLVSAGGTFLPAGAILNFFNAQTPVPSAGTWVQSYEKLGDLTKREGEVLARIGQGKPTKIIAHELDLREGTVKIHIRRLMRKLGVSNRTQAALVAQRILRPVPADDEDRPPPAEGFA